MLIGSNGDIAKRYLTELGWVPIPIFPKDKKPLIDWKPYQTKKPSIDEVREWWARWPGANIGIVTGQISGIIVFDIDGPTAENFIREQGGFPITPQSKTGKGTHYVMQCPTDLKINNSSDKKHLLDVRGDGGYFLVSPSIHPSGVQYEWAPGLSPWDVKPAPLRDWMIQYFKDHSNNGGKNRIEVKPSSGDWEIAKREISKHSNIVCHLITPKPDDRSGHDWRLVRLCLEAGIKDPKLLYQVILNNPHGKAASYPGGTDKYIGELISNSLAQLNVEREDEGEFPKDAIKGLAKEFADTYTEYLESPWSFWAFAFLTCLGNILSDRLTIDSEIRPQPRLYTVLLGESADERKSECLKQTVNFFSENLPNEFAPCLGVGSAEGLAERIKKYPKTILVYDEMKVFVSKAIIESSVLLPCVNTLFESNRFHSHTKGHSIEVDQGYLSILAASTIDTYQRMWSSAFTDIGFINRLWLVPDRGERRFPIPRSIEERDKEVLREKLLSIVNAIPTRLRSLEISLEARELFTDWYNGTPKSIFTKRLDTYGHRLMILFCANENTNRVTPDIAERVVRLVEWQRSVREQNDVIDAEGRIAKMEEGIRRALKKCPLGKRELQRNTHYDRAGIFVWDSALKNLTRNQEIIFDPKRQLYKIREGAF